MLLIKINQLRLVWFLLLELKLDLMVRNESLNIAARVYFIQRILDKLLSPQANLLLLVRSARNLPQLKLRGQRVRYVHRLGDGNPLRHDEVIPLHIV